MINELNNKDLLAKTLHIYGWMIFFVTYFWEPNQQVTDNLIQTANLVFRSSSWFDFKFQSLIGCYRYQSENYQYQNCKGTLKWFHLIPILQLKWTLFNVVVFKNIHWKSLHYGLYAVYGAQWSTSWILMRESCRFNIPLVIFSQSEVGLPKWCL